MFGHNKDAHEDDEDIKIVDIDVLDRQDKQRPLPAPRSPLAPRFSIRQRYLQLAITVGLVLVTLFILVSGNESVRNEVSSLISHTYPTTSLSKTTKYFYVSGSPQWGKLYIDGKRISHLPDPVMYQNLPMSLPSGRHVIQWLAAPFLPQSCVFTEPPDPQHDTCKYNQRISSSTGVSAWLFNFQANLTLVPSSLQEKLVLAIESALDHNAPTTMVLPGESYAVDSSGQPTQIAHVPLKATLHYYLDTSTSGEGICSTPIALNIPCVYANQECHAFCSVQLYPAKPDAWDVLVVVQALWSYTMLNGRLVAQGQPEIAGGNAYIFEHFLPFRIIWDGVQWHATMSFSMLPIYLQQFFDPACNAAANHTRTDPSQQFLASSPQQTLWRYVSESNSALGCLGMVSFNEKQGAPQNASQSVAYCLHRFGVFIAANALAHKYWPNMPVADFYEQQLAQQLASTYQEIQ